MASRLKELRSASKLTQLDLSKMVGVSQQTIGSWEVGRTSPDPDMIVKLSIILDASTEYLLGASNVNETHPYGHDKREKAKGYFNEIVRQPDKYSAADIAKAYEEMLIGYFHRSILKTPADVQHPSQKDYIAMLLYNPRMKNILLNDEAWQMLLDKYGAFPGIQNGQTYWYNNRLPIAPTLSIASNPNNSSFIRSFARIPVLGRIPAGSPALAFESAGEYEDIPLSWLNGDPENYFILRVDGDSMEGARIFDGDSALIKKCPTCENGQICAVGIMGDQPDLYATLKRVYELDDEYIELVPENSKYQRRKVKRSDVNIFGVLKQTTRKY